MGGKGKKATIGYQYYLGVHMGLVHGPIDNISRISVDQRVAWEGTAESGTSRITVDAPNLFGGEKREGGISGIVDIDFGAPDQAQNEYLKIHLGDDVPAFRGITSAVLNQCYMGNNPYLKPWSFRAQRIYTTTDGATQWYSGVAGISNDGDSNSDVAGTYCVQDCLAYDALLEQLHPDGVLITWTATADPTADWVWPFSATAGEKATKWTAYYWLVSGAVQGTNWSGSSPGSGYRRSTLANWGWTTGDQLGFCGVPTAVMDMSDVGTVEAIYIPENLVAHEDYGFTMTIAGYSGVDGPLHELLRNGGKRFSAYRAGPTYLDSPTMPMWLNMYSTLGVWKLSVTIGGGTPNIGPGITTTEVDIGDIDEQWLFLAGNVEVGTPVIAPNLRDVSIPCTVTLVLTRADGTTQNIVASGSREIGYGWDVISVVPEVHYFYSRPTFMDQQTSASIAIAQLSYGPVIDPENLQLLSQAWLSTFPSFEPIEGCEYTCADMNPAHIIRECLVEPRWGMGHPTSDIDDTSFRAAALTLSTERMGMSLTWSKEMPLEDFIGVVLKHIDAVLYVSRTTGKFVLKLIREEPDSNYLVLDESNVSAVKNARRPTVGELTASVTVNFWDSVTGEDASVTHHNQALHQIQQGGGESTTRSYNGFTNYDIANRVAQRDLKVLSSPFLSCVITANREAEELNIGDAFFLVWPDLDINAGMRVMSMELGDSRKNEITIHAMEDVYDTPGYGEAAQGENDDFWTDPLDDPPLPASPRLITEAPYYFLVQDYGETDTNNYLLIDADAGGLLAAGGRTNGEINADLSVDSGGGANADETLDFSPYAYLVTDVDYTDTVIPITGGVDVDLVEVGTIAQIDDELVRVDEVVIDSAGDATSIRVGRGVLDTTPDVHILDSSSERNAGDTIIFWGESYATDEQIYTASDELDVQILTRLSEDVLATVDAPTDSVTMRSRAIRPYPPGQLRIDGEAYPDEFETSAIEYDGNNTITWAHRDRLQQTDGSFYDYREDSIGPEAGTTYILRIEAFNASNDSLGIFLDVNVGSGTTFTGDSNTAYDSNALDSNNDGLAVPPLGARTVKIMVYSLRDSYESWQPAHVILPAFTDVDSVGDSVGIDSVGIDSVGIDSVGIDSVGDSVGPGVDSVGSGGAGNRFLEDGTNRYTEDGTPRNLEDA